MPAAAVATIVAGWKPSDNDEAMLVFAGSSGLICSWIMLRVNDEDKDNCEVAYLRQLIGQDFWLL